MRSARWFLWSVVAVCTIGCSEEAPSTDSSKAETASKQMDQVPKQDPTPKRDPAPAAEPDTAVPAVGSRYETGGSQWIVVAAGQKPFEYTAGEKSVVVAVPGTGPIANLVPGKGAKMRVDPSIPMLWINGEENKYFKSQRAIQEAARGKVILLLELP